MDEPGLDGDVLGDRRSTRARKVAPKVVAVMVDEGTRKRAASARLEALENDNTVAEAADAAADDDDLFEFEDLEDRLNKQRQDPESDKRTHVDPLGASEKRARSQGSADARCATGVVQRKLAARGPKRKTRQAKALERQAGKKAARTFAEVLQEARLEALPPHVPSYLTAAVGPPSAAASRQFCSVCGFSAPYTCTRCGARFCSCKCRTVHADTRCLKFVT
eukprot:jgi/Mesen1/6498/ME000332S05505